MKTLREIVKDQFFTADYVKLDGSRRTLNGRMGVTKYLKPNSRMSQASPNDHATMYELGKGYRSLRLNQVVEIHANHKKYTAIQLNKDAPVYFVEV